MQHLDDHDPIGNEVLNKRAIASPTRSKRKMKPKPKPTTKKKKIITKPAPAAPTPAKPTVIVAEPGKSKGKLPPWLTKFQKKATKVKKRG